ncbi:hypothetical protein QCA50_012144 [Cerrena zonata]|uniref:Uncharacterized protein n=1 Tax=Cerrena zonata TaxID=2478898 RepID=A0AAW0G7B8_9APHY
MGEMEKEAKGQPVNENTLYIEEAGGMEKIFECQANENEKIYEKAYSIIEKYFSDDDDQIDDNDVNPQAYGDQFGFGVDPNQQQNFNFDSVLLPLLPAAKRDNTGTVTVTVTGSTQTHKDGRFDKTKPASTSSSSGTHKYGRFDKTKPASSSSSTGTHKDGRFDKTKPASTSSSSGTHKYGRFDKTKPASTSSSSGTHKYGRFDKTKPASTSSATGTHKDGRFDKTKPPVTTTVYVQPSSSNKRQFVANKAANVSGNSSSNSTNGSSGASSTTADSGAVLNGFNLGVAGAIAAGMVLVV